MSLQTLELVQLFIFFNPCMRFYLRSLARAARGRTTTLWTRSTSSPPLSSRSQPSWEMSGWNPRTCPSATPASPPASDRKWALMAETPAGSSGCTSLRRSGKSFFIVSEIHIQLNICLLFVITSEMIRLVKLSKNLMPVAQWSSLTENNNSFTTKSLLVIFLCLYHDRTICISSIKAFFSSPLLSDWAVCLCLSTWRQIMGDVWWDDRHSRGVLSVSWNSLSHSQHCLW